MSREIPELQNKKSPNFYIQRTAQEQRELISELIKLSLYFSSEYQKQHPKENISAVIINQTSMWEIIGLRGTAEESFFTYGLSELYEKTASSVEFETEGLTQLLPYMDTFTIQNIEWEKKVLTKYHDSCFRYDHPKGECPSNHCNFHITNYIAPKSILRENEYTIDCFLRLMYETEKKFGFNILRTGTWLNSVPQWLKFFPEEWISNMEESVIKIHGSLGFWGQIITARKTFNFKTGNYIRTHLELPFKNKTAWCSFKAMKKHLEKFSP